MAASSTASSDARSSVHPVDRVPPVGRLLTLGLQHVLIMYTGCVTVPLVFGAAVGLDASTIGLLINADLLVAGIITIIQSLGVGKVLGVRLPVVAGATFAAVTPMILIAGEYGLQAVYGSFLAAGVFGLLVAVPFARVVRFFPPVVTGVTITVIGLSLIGVAGGLIAGNDPTAEDYALPSHLGLAAAVVVTIVLVTRFVRGFLGQLAVLAGLAVGVVLAAPMGLIDFSAVGSASWVGLAQPFLFGAPEFPPAAVIAMCIVMLVIFTESTADMLAVGELVGRPVTPKALARGLAADGLSGILAGSYNAFLDTAFAQNVGLISMTGVRSRFVVTAAGGILVVLGLVPKIGEVFASLPGPVIGGAGLVMFATVAAVGVRTLARVDWRDRGNSVIVAVAIGVGMLPVVKAGVYGNFPSWVQIILGSAITGAVLTAFVLNLLFHHLPWRPVEPEPAHDEPLADTTIDLTAAGGPASGLPEGGMPAGATSSDAVSPRSGSPTRR